jgi:hypothetical protein
MYYLFLDESGDHSYKKIEHSRFFTLAGCIFNNSSEYLNYINAVVRTYRLKEKYFGNFFINLHTREILRNESGFESVANEKFRNSFFNACNALIKKTEFILICSVVDKKELVQKYGEKAADPYFYSFDRLLERFVYFLDSAPGDKKGIIFYESRRADLDKKLEMRFQNIMQNGVLNIDGSITVSMNRIRKRIIKLVKLNKDSNTTGIEFADLCASPVTRRFLGYKDNFIKFNVIETKFIRLKGKIDGCSLTIIKT